MRAESLVTVAVYDAGADGNKLEQLRVPLQAFDRELDADYSIRTHGSGLSAHPR